MRQYMHIMAASCVLLSLFCTLFLTTDVKASPEQSAMQQQKLLQQREKERQQELLRQHRRSLEKPPIELKSPAPLKETIKTETSCFNVHTIVLKGVTLLTRSEQDFLKKPYLNRCLTLQDINALVRDITNFYTEKGFVTTRAFIPEQDLKEGLLKLLIIEGKVEQIKFKNKTPYAKRKLALAFPGMVGDYLNMRDIEQGLDQLNRLPSNNARVHLIPGTEAGTSVVLIENEPKKTWRGTIGMDNSGQKSTGILQYSLALEKDNLLYSNDLLTLNYSGDYESMVLGEHQDSQSFSAFYSVGVGYWTVTGSWSRFAYHTELEGLGASYSSTGTTVTSSLGVDRVIHRDADSKTSLGMNFLLRDTSNYLARVKLKASSHILTSLSLSAIHTQRMLGGILTLDGQYSRGLPLCGAKSDPSGISASTPKAEFNKVTLGANFYRPFQIQNHNFSWSTKAWGQWSPDTLYSAERASVGSRHTVRGFHEDSLSGDIGGYLHNELALNLPLGAAGSSTEKFFSNLQVFLGYDAGFIWKDPKDEYEKGSVQGAALGIRTRGGNIIADATISKPLDAPSHMKKDDLDFYASVKITF